MSHFSVSSDISPNGPPSPPFVFEHLCSDLKKKKKYLCENCLELNKYCDKLGSFGEKIQKFVCKDFASLSMAL